MGERFDRAYWVISDWIDEHLEVWMVIAIFFLLMCLIMLGLWAALHDDRVCLKSEPTLIPITHVDPKSHAVTFTWLVVNLCTEYQEPSTNDEELN